MSLFPRIPGQRKSPFQVHGVSRTLGGGSKHQRRQAEGIGKERITLPSIHGDHTTTTYTNTSARMSARGRSNPSSPFPPRGRTAKLKAPRVLHTPPKNRRSLPGGIIASSSPLKTCHFCGREFGGASISIHEKQCGVRLLKRQAVAAEDTDFQSQITDNSKSCDRIDVKRASRNKLDRRDLAVSKSWEPFSCQCQYCGEKYGQHSIAVHERRCPNRLQQASHIRRHTLSHQDSEVPTEVPRKADKTSNAQPLSPGSELIILPRPQTRTLDRSLLIEGGHGLPTVAAMTVNPEEQFVVCVKCGCSVPVDRTSVHERACRTRATSEVTGKPLVFPSQARMTIGEKGFKQEERRKDVVIGSGKPPTIVCYICGREYGTKSISIHEPQCLRKWQIENSKLPISKRKSLPKKRTTVGSKAPSVLRVTSREDTVIVGHLPDACSAQNLEKFVEDYYLQCYEEFERDLQQCSKCGRTFAPERMVKHTGRCNAKPLKK